MGCKSDTVSEQTSDPEQPVTYTVTFNTNGGSEVKAQTIVSGQKVSKPSDPTRADYVFDGWYSDEGLTNVYKFDIAVTDNTPLYAKWEQIIEMVSVPGGTVPGTPHPG